MFTNLKHKTIIVVINLFNEFPTGTADTFKGLAYLCMDPYTYNGVARENRVLTTRFFQCRHVKISVWLTAGTL